MKTELLPVVRDAAAILAQVDARPPRRKKRRHARRGKHEPSAPPQGARADINITPLVDVVLVLLIIFMVVTPLLHRGVEVELPQTRNHLTRQDTGEQLVVSVREGGAYVEGERIPIEALGAAVAKELKHAPHRPVNVQAAKTLKFGEVRKVIDQVHAAGALQVNMETKEGRKD